MQMGIIIPQNVSLKVGDQESGWEEGKVFENHVLINYLNENSKFHVLYVEDHDFNFFDNKLTKILI